MSPAKRRNPVLVDGEVAEKNAAVCRHCLYVYDPLQAYKSTLIDYTHIAMTRLTTEQWKEANEIKEEREEKKRKARTARPS